MLYHKYKPLAARVYCTGLALLLVLSEVFSSNVQDTLPGFSRIMRLGLTGCAVLLLAGKIILLTGYEARWQKVLIAVVLVYTAFSSWYGGDLWFFLAALVGLGAKDVDWETALRVYLVTAVAGLVLVQALHFATPLMPYKFYCRNWDFGYGHYNGFGARLVGVFFAWAWLRHDRLRAFDWAGLAALAIFTYKVPGSRGAFGGMAVLFVLFFVLASVITTVLQLPASITAPIKELSKFFIVMAMAAIGFNTDIVELVKKGGKPIALGFCCWIGIACMSLGMQHVLGIW